MGKRLLSLVLPSLAVLGCQPSDGEGGNAAPLLINGAGSTFGYPIYSKWFEQLKRVQAAGQQVAAQ